MEDNSNKEKLQVKKNGSDASKLLDEKYWLAFFFGSIISCVTVVSILPYLSEKVHFLINLVAWITIICSILFLGITLYKDGVFRFFFGVSESDVKDFEGQGISLVKNVNNKDWEKVANDIEILSRKGVAWYSWKNYRSWVLGLFNTLFLAFIGLFGSILLYNQNQLLEIQNGKIDLQNEKVNIQNNLMEAERRSSLIFLMSNILDKVDDEIKDQKKFDTVTQNFTLSNPLIGSIVALSRAFRPYHLLEKDHLSKKKLSPERGQLFIALMESELDSFSQNTIVKEGDFSNAIIGDLVLDFSNLIATNFNGADLSGINLNNAKLQGTNFNDANLKGASLKYANLTPYVKNGYFQEKKTDFTGANLISANLLGSNLTRAVLQKSNLTNAVLLNANFSSASLDGVKLNGAFLNGTNFSDASLVGVDFRGAKMIPMHINIFEGNGEYGFTVFKGASLRNSNFEGVDLGGINFTNCNLQGVNFLGATNITVNQLSKAISLLNAKGLNLKLKEELLKIKPCLFSENACKLD